MRWLQFARPIKKSELEDLKERVTLLERELHATRIRAAFMALKVASLMESRRRPRSTRPSGSASIPSTGS